MSTGIASFFLQSVIYETPLCAPLAQIGPLLTPNRLLGQISGFSTVGVEHVRMGIIPTI